MVNSMTVPPQAWSPVGGPVWEAEEPSEGWRNTVRDGFESTALLHIQPTLCCVTENGMLSCPLWLPAAVLPQPLWTLPVEP